MLKLTKKEKKITVETGSGKLTWDANKGGEIVEFSCKNEKESHKLLSFPHSVCGLKFIIDGSPYLLS
ncbi:MAG TPA: hypothetical protein PL060_04925, partial [bacterium]|nr:hypothetical protein [bacterium]